MGGADSDYFESSGPLRGRKGSLYEGGIRVPLIARWKGQIAGGRVTEHVAAFWDVLPTLCEVAQTESPAAIDGISFAPTLLDAGNQAKHDYLYREYPAHGHQQAVRAGEGKAVRHNVNREGSEFELYNQTNDIGERRNVAAEHPEIVRRMNKVAHAAH